MRDILFVGRILASVTHDMQNVMAIIKESGALTDDILRLNGPPKMRYAKELATALVNIEQQVERGRRLMFMLNGFAHAAADHPERCDLLRFARQISVLAERMVRLKECTLKTSLEGDALYVSGNALVLMQGIYLGIAAVLEGCEAGDLIQVAPLSAEEAGDKVVLRIQAEKSIKIPEEETLAKILSEIGASFHAGEGFLDLSYLAAPGDRHAG